LILVMAFAPFLRKPLIVVDLILRKPHTLKQRILAWLKRMLLQRVDHFVFYFKSLEGYERFYGISSGRSSYVPFKSNIIRNPRLAEIASGEKEEYVYTAGRSLRDYDTFFEAVAELGYPAAIPRPQFAHLWRH